jgi:Ase1/PRC1/MAP65 family protein
MATDVPAEILAPTALTPGALLESLHFHLTSQTSLLPALHAQLGLPPSALQTELEQIRATLAEAVEAQIQKRQYEVSKWMDQCEEIEKECLDFVKALGTHAKSLPSVGELRKQQVCAVFCVKSNRFEMAGLVDSSKTI